MKQAPVPGCGAWQPEKITVVFTRAAFGLGLIGGYSKCARVCWCMRWGGWGVELSTLLCVSGIRGSEERHTYATTTKSYLYIERETKTWDSGYTSRTDRIGKNQDGRLGLCRALSVLGVYAIYPFYQLPILHGTPCVPALFL